MVTTSKLWKKIVSKTLSSKKKKKYMQVACLDKYYCLSSNPLAKYENRNNDLYVTLFFFFWGNIRDFMWTTKFFGSK